MATNLATLVFKEFKHLHVSEREKAHFWPDGRHDDAAAEDCLWCSAIEVLRWGGLDIPATPAEAEAMRAASGEPPTGPSNPDNLLAGAKKRYKIKLAKQNGNGLFWDRFTVGSAAIISGSLKAFPAGHTLRKHQPSSQGPHAVAVFRFDDQPRAWWCDPLAFKASWPGIPVSRDQVEAFMAQLPNSYIIVRHNQFLAGGPISGNGAAAAAAKPVGPPTGMIRTSFAGIPAGNAVSNRIGHAFDLGTRGVRVFPANMAMAIIAEVRLEESLSQSLPKGELMLLTSGPKSRFELVRAKDTDWPAGRRA
jgi:hypothetical protein